MSRWHDALIKIDRISWILSPERPVMGDDTTVIPGEDRTLWVLKEDDPENWHVQVYTVVSSELNLIYFSLFLGESGNSGSYCYIDFMNCHELRLVPFFVTCRSSVPSTQDQLRDSPKLLT